MRKYLVSCILMAIALDMALPMMAQTRRALLVGISAYKSPLNGYTWHNIHGANDVALMASALKGQGFSCSDLTDAAATHDNIVSSFNGLVAASKPGDIVLFLFSGHGQPVEDCNGDEADGWDESIVPIDAWKHYDARHYHGEKHIVDDDFRSMVSSLRRKVGPNGMVYIVIDACHAGTFSRGDNDTPIRGTIEPFCFSTKSKVYKPRKIETANYYRVAHSPNMSDVVFLEACRPYQFNREIVAADGKSYGPLAYNLAVSVRGGVDWRKPESVVNKLMSEILTGDKWPMSQNLVVEKSY